MTKLSQIEHSLTVHIRQYLTRRFSKSTIRKYSFIVALTSCLFDASVVTFSIFTPQFIEKLHYNQVDINIIGGCMSIGLYLSLPFLGYMSDAHGPVLLALLSMMLCPGYLLATATFDNGWGFEWMALAFTVIGTGTSAAYFCSLLTCAKIYPERKGLSISLPVACYGLSSLFLSCLFKLDFFNSGVGSEDSGSQLRVHLIFVCLSVMYFVVCLLNWVASCVVTIEKEILFNKTVDDQMGPPSTSSSSDSNSPDEDSPLLTSEFMEPRSHERKFKDFLNDPTMKFMYLAIFFLGGTLELFVTNLGSLTQTVGINPSENVGFQVSLFSFFSTVTRLTIAGIAEYYKSAKSTVKLIIGSTFITMIAYILIAIDFQSFSFITCLIGIGYASMFTLFPTLVATIWSVEILGSAWGLYLSAPAFGSLVFGMFYAFEFDQYCNASVESGLKYTVGVYCLTFPYALFTGFVGVSVLTMWLCWKLDWSKRVLRD